MEALSPIPNPLPNDDEDVSWALSTAGALWGRGERSEALKWLRRAAEQASDVNDDVRALTLFKAAAEVAQQASSITPPPPTASVAPPAASVAPPAPPAPSVAPPAVALFAPAAASSPPPRRKAPPSLPPRAATTTPVAAPRAASPSVPSAPPLQTSLQAAPAARSAPPPAGRSAPPPPATRSAPPAPARRAPSTEAPIPLTKPSRSQPAAPVAQVSPAAGSMPVIAAAGASMPVRRPEAMVTRTPLSARAAGQGATATTRPATSNASKASPAATPPPSSANERPPSGRSGRAFEEILALQNSPRGLVFDDLEESTQVLQAVRSTPMSRKGTAQEIDESFDSLLSEGPSRDSEPADEPTDPGLHPRALDDVPPEDATGPMSAPSNSAMWTAPDRSALLAGPDNLGTETTSHRFAPLLAHRVAVMASRTPGELRVVPFDASGAPPAGAAIAMLVPLSAADDDVMVRLFGSLE